MAPPFPPHTTCHIYRPATSPPAAPAVAGVRSLLQSSYARCLEQGENDPADWQWTHVLLVDRDTDIRDDYALGVPQATRDSVYIPTQSGTRYDVLFVERKGRGTPADHKKVYLRRYAPSWPSENV